HFQRVNNSEMLSRASLGDVLRVARKASRSVRLSCALGRQRDASYDRLVNNSKRSFGEMLSRASLGDVLRVARKASRSVRLSCALGRQRDASYDRLVNNSKRSFGEMLSRASLGDVLRVARKASRSVRLSCALGRQRDAFYHPGQGGSLDQLHRFSSGKFAGLLGELTGTNDDSARCAFGGDYPVEFPRHLDSDFIHSPIFTLNEKMLAILSQDQVNSAIGPASACLCHPVA